MMKNIYFPQKYVSYPFYFIVPLIGNIATEDLVHIGALKIRQGRLLRTGENPYLDHGLHAEVVILEGVFRSDEAGSTGN